MTSQTKAFPSRLAFLIPRLATSYDGELVATRDAITRILGAAGLDWHDIAHACTTACTTADPRPYPPPFSFGDLARAARDLDRGRLTERERLFVADMVRRGFSYRPSPRQTAWLDAIILRLKGRAAA